MKFLQAYKDASGFHYVVDLDETNPNSIKKVFNYEPLPKGFRVDSVQADAAIAAGATAVAVADAPVVNNASGSAALLTGPQFIQETEDQYRARIEAEIQATCVMLKTGSGLTPTVDLPVKGKGF